MGFQIIKPNTNYDFVGKRRLAYILSIGLVLVGLLSLGIKGGPRLGIDFAGGVIVQVKFQEEMELSELTSVLAETDLPALVVQRFGDRSDNEFLMRTSAEDITPSKVRESVDNNLTQHYQ
ncbi:MAG: protein translocase subunit SecF, partial [Desulfonatronovibrio sp.]